MILIDRKNAKVLRSRQAGASMIEYALVVLLIAGLGSVSVNSVGTVLTRLFLEANDSLGESVGNPDSGVSNAGEPSPP